MGEHLQYSTGGHLKYSTGGHLKYKTAFTPGTDCAGCGGTGQTPHAISVDLTSIFTFVLNTFTVTCGSNIYSFTGVTSTQNVPQKGGTPCTWELTLVGAGTFTSGGVPAGSCDLHIKIIRSGGTFQAFVDSTAATFFQSGVTSVTGCINPFTLTNTLGSCPSILTTKTLNFTPN